MMPVHRQRRFDRLQERLHAVTVTGGDPHHVLPHRDLGGIHQLSLVVATQDLGTGLGQLGDQTVHHLDMLFPVRICRIDHIPHLFRHSITIPDGRLKSKKFVHSKKSSNPMVVPS